MLVRFASADAYVAPRSPSIQQDMDMTTHASAFPLPIRGVHLDCRAQMLRFERIIEILDDLARWGFNTVLFEYEDRFPFDGALRGVAAEDALTKGQVREINKVAASLGLGIIPPVQCLGHLEYVLRLPRLRSLAEPHRAGSPPCTVCPSHPRWRHLIRDLTGQVLDLHGDCRYFHMGGDEVALDPTCPRCRDRLGEQSVSAMLVDHYVDHADWVRRRGPDPIVWGDMVLRHHEALDRLRGHVTIMDWDYMSPVGRGATPWLWGAVFPDGVRSPIQGELVDRYMFEADGKTARPFPYVRFLRDRGFQVIVASAARCCGDTFCVPFPNHVDNVMAGARVAADSHVLGSVITSWALRRSPWPLTEHALIAGAMAMRDPDASRRAIDTAFALEHFGQANPRLAQIPVLLGTQLRPLLDADPVFQTDTGHWLGRDYPSRVARIGQDVGAYASQLAKLRANVRQAEKLLATVAPRTARQRERVRLWRWAAEVLGHFAAFGDQVLTAPGSHDVKGLKAFRSAAVRLARRTAKVLAPLYTAPTLADEERIRFGIHVDYLDAMIAAARVPATRA